MEVRGRRGRWRLLRRLGRGVHAEVWLARGAGGGEAVVKVAGSGPSRLALAREGELLGRLGRLAALPRLLDRGEDGAFLVLERVPGEPADAWARGRPVAEVVELLARVAEALAALHAAGVAHGDLKPANVLVEPGGRPRLLDLGVAALPAPAASAGYRGTLGFGAPEQLRGRAPDAASDLWALGALGTALLTGRPPFSGIQGAAAFAWLPVEGLPLPPSSRRPDLPAALDAVLLHLCARDPARRPAGARQAAAMLRAAATGRARPVVGAERLRLALGRLVVRAVEGEGVAAALVGPPGSGRRTLLEEAAEAAEREGLARLRSAGELRRGPGVLVLDEDDPGVAAAAAHLSAGGAGLLLVRARGVPPGMHPDDVHAVPPLTEEEAVRWLGALGVPPERARALHAAARGRPGPMRAALRADQERPAGDAGRLLRALGAGPAGVEALARRLGWSAHRVLDVAEPLIERGIVEERDGGAVLARSGAGGGG